MGSKRQGCLYGDNSSAIFLIGQWLEFRHWYIHQSFQGAISSLPTASGKPIITTAGKVYYTYLTPTSNLSPTAKYPAALDKVIIQFCMARYYYYVKDKWDIKLRRLDGSGFWSIHFLVIAGNKKLCTPAAWRETSYSNRTITTRSSQIKIQQILKISLANSSAR